MGLCLVTKLKESVADSSLTKIGEKTIVLLPQGQVTLRGKGVEIRAINGSFNITPLNGSVENVKNYTLGDPYYFLDNPTQEPVVLGVNNRELLTVLTAKTANNQIEIGLSFFDTVVKLQELVISHQKVTDGTLANLAGITKDSTLINFKFNQTIGLMGSLNDIASLKMADSVLPELSFCTDVTGSVEEFVKGQRANGRTTANITNNYWLTKNGITFNGKTYKDLVNTSWTASTITINDETINA